MPPSTRATRLTLFSLFIGYTGYYLCRSNLSVASPLIVSDLSRVGIDKSAMGDVASWGVIAYAVGKLINGITGDLAGGKTIFIFGMLGSVVATVAFGLSGGVAAFTVVWFLNRFVQSMGWAGLVRIASQWVDYRQYGKVMGILSLSYLVGDIAARLVLGQFITWGYDWRTLFFIAAALLGIIALFNLVFLKETPAQAGVEAPAPNPANLFAEAENQEKISLRQILTSYFTSFSFILILLMSFGLTAIRETLNFWSPQYLHDVFSMKPGEASQISSLYLVAGGFSILLAGWLSDKLSGKRGLLIALGCLPMALIFGAMNFSEGNAGLSITLLSAAGFFLLGPYSFLAGSMALDMGGKKGAATAAGLADSFGYLGGTLAVKMTGILAEKSWNHVFLMLSGISLATAAVAFTYFFSKEKK
jgi:sugar phosphate permease